MAKTLKSVSVSATSTGTLISAYPGRRIKVYAVRLISDAIVSFKFRSGASTDLDGAQALAANGGFVESVTPPSFLFATAKGESLDIVITGTGTVAGRISYWANDAQ